VTVEYRNKNDAIAAAITNYRHYKRPVYVRQFEYSGTGLKGKIWVLEFEKPSSDFVTIDDSVEKWAHLYGR
jgi:hypothetical protein